MKVYERINKKVWFNSIGAVWGRKEINVTYGNGDEIEPENHKTMLGILCISCHLHFTIDHMIYIMFDICVAFKWQQGDVLLIDNKYVPSPPLFYFFSFLRVSS